MEAFTKALDKLRATVDTAAEANLALAIKQQGERDSAIQAANDAGLSVDAGALPLLGAAEAHPRFQTLQNLLADAQAQHDQIKNLTG